MLNDADWSWLSAAAEAPEMTIEVHESLPEDLARGIEVVDTLDPFEVTVTWGQLDEWL